MESKGGKSQMAFIFDLAESDLEKFIKLRHKDGINLPQVIDFCQQLFEGIKVLHESGFIHRDLKPANLLVKENRARDGFMGCSRPLQIADFGLCRLMPAVK